LQVANSDRRLGASSHLRLRKESLRVPIKTFDNIQSLSEWYDAIVFRSISDDTLFVEDMREHRWYRYRWTRGRREVKFVEEHEGALPLVMQIYP
jgi:hypothetical protein